MFLYVRHVARARASSSWRNIKKCECVFFLLFLLLLHPPPLLRGNWIFIAFDDCRFVANKTVERAKDGRKRKMRFSLWRQWKHFSWWFLAHRPCLLRPLLRLDRDRINSRLGMPNKTKWNKIKCSYHFQSLSTNRKMNGPLNINFPVLKKSREKGKSHFFSFFAFIKATFTKINECLKMTNNRSLKRVFIFLSCLVFAPRSEKKVAKIIFNKL